MPGKHLMKIRVEEWVRTYCVKEQPDDNKYNRSMRVIRNKGAPETPNNNKCGDTNGKEHYRGSDVHAS